MRRPQRDLARALTLTALATVPLAAQRPAPAPIDVSGRWTARLDPADVGLRERWFAAALTGVPVELPGTTDLAGLSDPDPRCAPDRAIRGYIGGTRVDPAEQGSGHLERPHGYIGPAWYERTVTLPPHEHGVRFELVLERCLWTTTAFVDGVAAGTADSLVAEHRHLLPQLDAGPHRLTLRIDNRPHVAIGTYGHAYGEETQSRWNGAVGSLTLEPRAPVALRGIDVFTAPDRRGVSLRVRITNDSPGVATGRLRVAIRPDGDPSAPVVGELDVAIAVDRGEREVALDVPLAEPALGWDEFDPQLYRLDATLASGVAPPDVRAETFGFRDFRRDGRRLTLDGRPLFLRGTLECCVFPRTGHPPMDVAAWRRVLGTIREHGFDHVRFHSWCPPRAAFRAADELGLYLQPETPLWIDGWMTSIGPEPPRLFGRDPEVVAFVRREVARMLDAYGNHPSFCMLTLGNELHADSDYRELGAMVTAARERDPRRLYAISTARLLTPADDYFVTHRTPGGPVRGVGPAHTDHDFRRGVEAVDVPLIAHETGQRPTFPDFAALAKFDGPLRPAGLAVLRDRLAALGLADRNAMFTRASGAFALVQYRAEIEALLRTPDCAGFQLLMLNDFPGQGEALVGLLDAFWDDKGIVSPAELRAFCGPTVPLLRVGHRVFDVGDSIEARVELAHYGPRDVAALDAQWSLRRVWPRSDGEPLARGELATVPVHTGGITQLGAVSVPIADLPIAAPCTLELEVAAPALGARNAWRLWVCEDGSPATVSPATVSPATVSPGVVVCDAWDDAVRDALERGAAVVLVAHGLRNDRAFGDRFLSVYWSAAMFPDTPGTLGLYCDPAHPALARFPAGSHSDWQWADLAEGATTFDLTGLSRAIEPIVGVVPDFHRPRHLAQVFELRVGRGRLLVCGQDLLSALGERPAARQLRASLLAYVASPAFAPDVELDPGELGRLLAPLPSLAPAPPTAAELADACLDVSAAARLVERSRSAAWRPELDELRASRAGYGVRVLRGEVWRDADGSFWHGAPLVVAVDCPAGAAGDLLVLLRDSNGLGRRGVVALQGRGHALGAHDGAGLWARLPFDAADSASGRLVLRATPDAGPNLMIERLAVLARPRR
ncbi:MAG: hypothetical protein IPM29_30530 [Planctomycetes bacterium]|nr:hypothetical protein [Planctomycetota bacterium]